MNLKLTKYSSNPVLPQAATKFREMKYEVEYRDAVLTLRLSTGIAFVRLNGAYVFSDVVRLSEESEHLILDLPLRKPIGVSLIGLLSMAFGLVVGQSDVARTAFALGVLTVLIAVGCFLSFVLIVRADVRTVIRNLK